MRTDSADSRESGWAKAWSCDWPRCARNYTSRAWWSPAGEVVSTPNCQGTSMNVFHVLFTDFNVSTCLCSDVRGSSTSSVHALCLWNYFSRMSDLGVYSHLKYSSCPLSPPPPPSLLSALFFPRLPSAFSRLHGVFSFALTLRRHERADDFEIQLRFAVSCRVLFCSLPLLWTWIALCPCNTYGQSAWPCCWNLLAEARGRFVKASGPKDVIRHATMLV